MKDREGTFTLVAVVGQNIEKPNLWHAAGYVHAEGEVRYLESVRAGTDFETRQAAVHGGIEGARQIARRLDPDDSWAKRDRDGRL